MILLKSDSIDAILISIKLSFMTTIILLILAVPLAYWLSYKSSAIKIIVEVFVTLPLVLPPSVMGFYLLILLNKNSSLGKIWYQITGNEIVFHFSGLLIGSIIYSLPFVVKPIQNSFLMIPKQSLEAAATLGANSVDRFFSIALPNAREGIITGALLAFTHTLGEFGVVLMLGGNIPGKTKTISIAIFDSVEQLEYSQAHLMSLLLLSISFFSIFCIYYLNRKSKIKLLKFENTLQN